MKRLTLLLSAAAIVLTSCSSKNDEQTEKDINVPLVKTVKVEERTFNPTLTFSGTVFANKEANLGATLPGKVEKIFFEEGQSVKKGDLIVELSDEMLTQALIEHETIKKDFERVSRLREKGSISEMEYDHVKAKYDASTAKVEMVRKNTQVYAPFSGIIAERMMEEGEIYFINPGLEPGYSMRSGIVRLMQLDPVKIKFEVNEKDLSKIRKGLPVEVRMDAFPGRTFKGEVNNIKPMLSTTTHSTPVEVVISNAKMEIKPGMFAFVDVKLPEIKSAVVPLRSIYRMPGTSEDYVFTVVNDTVHRVKVERVQTLGEYVAVNGVNAGTEIILEGKNRVNDGLKVKVSNR
ncbi:MAG: rane fusion protein multidrug efflux system [Tenuifilum sp.]|jgi:membrane fusion protein (multidrug efflux system)|uniref:efflux RND transporter periplasmic adaptor subunit n=1 Tax=Tenuifilum sp. TaxID=2760880 RepID=UPI0024ABD60D|nr:efflux RND transporter periplasmic adaptor subunit [Tenuifilum sp.]MDI3526610.1 rane fusion protein multidrug efflux system [Tenuifilum sp.]